MKTGNSKMVGLIAAAVGVFLGVSGLCYYQFTQFADLGKDVVELQLKIENEGNIQGELDEINAMVADSRSKLDHLERGVPPKAYIPTMMTELESLGKTNKIEVLGVRPLPKKATAAPKKTEDGKVVAPPAKPYEEQDLEVKGTGEYMDVLAFLTALERFPKIVKVNQVTLIPKQDFKNPGKTTGRLDIAVELRAYLFKQDAPMPTMEEEPGKPLAMGGTRNEGI